MVERPANYNEPFAPVSTWLRFVKLVLTVLLMAVTVWKALTGLPI